MASPAATHAADPPAPALKVTQELLNSIHIAFKLIRDPFPAYAEKYLPFAMAASMESTQKGRLWLFFHQSVGRSMTDLNESHATLFRMLRHFFGK